MGKEKRPQGYTATPERLPVLHRPACLQEAKHRGHKDIMTVSNGILRDPFSLTSYKINLSVYVEETSGKES